MLTVSDLNYAVAYGIVDMTYLQLIIEQMRRKEIIENHPYSIWQGENGYWYTRVPDNTKPKNRRLVKRKNREDVENVIVDYWKNTEKRTFIDVYFQWREVQDQLVSCNTVAKYNTDFNRFFKKSPISCVFIDKRVETITDDDVKVFMRKTIEARRLQREPMRKLFSYISNTFEFALKKGIIAVNPIANLKSKDFVRYCYDVYKPDEEMTIQDDDMKLLQERFKLDHEKKPNYIPTYAVELASLTGMRVSEIAALRWDHVTEKYILVEFSEKSDQTKTQFWIDKTKNGTIRRFPMTREIQKLLDEVASVEKQYGYYCEWIFANENGRIHAKTISSCAKTKCKQIGINPKGKGIHGYRKTLNSKLRNAGVPTPVTASMLGHTIAVNEKYYTFDVSSTDEKAQIVEAINQETVGGY